MSLIRDGQPLRVVHTRKNTKLEDWKAIVREIAAKDNVDLSNVSNLAFKHAWEGEDTPVSFVTIVKLMNERAARSKMMKDIKARSDDR